jgi:hypothetical protein
MPGGFVIVPNALLDDAGLPDRALRLWISVRRFNGEGEFKACWASAAYLDAGMRAHGRRRTKAPAGRDHPETPWAYKVAQRALIERGLMVVRRGPAGRSARRWALRPGADGDMELNDLRDRGEIGDQEHMETQARRASYHPVIRRPVARPGGVVAPGIKN